MASPPHQSDGSRSCSSTRLSPSSSPFSPSRLPASSAVSSVPFAPTFHPTAAEFVHPYAYIRSIRSEAQLYGIVKIVPPKGWKFDCALDFEGVRFGTKAQRIDMLMHRGTGAGEGGPQEGPGDEGRSKAGKGRRGAGMMKSGRGGGKEVEESRRRPGRPRKAKPEEESKQAAATPMLVDGAEERKDEDDTASTTGRREMRRSPRTSSVGRTGSGSPRSSPGASPPPSHSSTSPAVPVRLLHVFDQDSFWSCLRRFHGRASPVPNHVYLFDTELIVQLYEFYRLVDECGGVGRVAATRGWRDVMARSGVGVTVQTHGMHRKFEKLWSDWLDSFWKAVKREERSWEADNKPAAVAAAASELVDGDDEVELMDDTEWQSQKQKRKRELNMDAGDGATEAAMAVRRSKRERRSLESLHASSASSAIIEELCRHCGQFDHHSLKLRCSTCNAVFHCFCLSPPLPAPPAPSAAPYVCRQCVEDEEGLFGFDAGRLYTLSSFQRQADEFKRRYFRLQADSVPPTAAQIATEFWRIVEAGDHSSPVCVEYGSDLDTQETGSVFPLTGAIANDGWNLRNLPRLSSSVLTALDDAAIEGISIPWLYVGMLFSAFCWHNEDHYSYSINYVAAGDDKQWYGVSAQHANAFERAMATKLPHLFTHSPDLLFHLITMLPPTVLQTDCSIYQLTQHAGEIVLTFPQAYHAGFNCGFNVAESVNFAPVDWLSFGLQCSVRYRFFHRQPVWCSEQVVLKTAHDVIAQWKERQNRGRKEDDDDKQSLQAGELPLWERAAWLYPALCRLRDEERELRRRLYLSGTARMQPWPAAADECSSAAASASTAAGGAFRMGDLVQVESEQANMRLWKGGVVVAIVCDGLYRVKLAADGLVREVEERSVRRQHRDEERRTHEWDEYQNVGVDGAVLREEESKEPSTSSPSRPARMASASSSSPAAAGASLLGKPSTVVPRCLICGHFLYLSCVRCSCTIDKPVCLSHAAELCGCAAQSKFGWFRFSLQQLDECCSAVQAIVRAERRRSDSSSNSNSNSNNKWWYVSKHRHNDVVMHIMNESEAILHRSDDYISAMHARIQQQQATRTPTAAVECIDAVGSSHLSSWSPASASCVPAWTAEVEQQWLAASQEWLAAHKPLVELEEPAFSASELDASVKQAERFIWADARMAPVYDVYRVFSTWQSQCRQLSMTLCSLISAHHYLLSLASALVKAIAAHSPHSTASTLSSVASSATPTASTSSSLSSSPSPMALLSELFLAQPSVSGWLSVAGAESLLSSIEHCPLHLSCVCDSIEGRYQRDRQRERRKADSGARRESRNEQRVAGHLRLLAKVIAVAKDQEAQVGRKDRGPMASLLPRSDCTALNEPAHNAISVACTAVVIDSRAQVVKWGRKDVLDALKTSAAVQPHSSLSPHLSSSAAAATKSAVPPIAAKASATVTPSAAAKQSISSPARKAASFAVRPPLSPSLPRFDLSQLPSYSPSMSCEALREPLVFTLSHALVDAAQKQIGLLSFTADQCSEQAAWLRAVERATLFASNAQPPSTPQLIALFRSFESTFGESADVLLSTSQLALVRQSAMSRRELAVVLLCMLRERLVKAALWASHCRRLLCTGGNSRLAEEGWGQCGGVSCLCKPLLAFAAHEPPQLSFCDCARASKASPAPPAAAVPVSSHSPLRRYRLCCASQLLSCPIVSFVDLADAPLLRQAKEQTVEWANRALKLIAPLPRQSNTKQPAAATAAASAASYVTLAYLHGLALEGDHVAFVPAAASEVRAHIRRVEEFQRRVLSQVDNVRRAVEERREEEAREALTTNGGEREATGRAPRRAGASAGRTPSPSPPPSGHSSTAAPLSAACREWWQCCLSLLDELIAEAAALRVSVEESRWCRRYRRDIQALLDSNHLPPHTPVSPNK